jgi:hypothetical protein
MRARGSVAGPVEIAEIAGRHGAWGRWSRAGAAEVVTVAERTAAAAAFDAAGPADLARVFGLRGLAFTCATPKPINARTAMPKTTRSFRRKVWLMRLFPAMETDGSLPKCPQTLL